MKMYNVTADVSSEKFGKGQLEAQLNETEFIEYANLSDKAKLDFLKEKNAQFKADFVDELSDEEVSNYSIKPTEETSQPVTSNPRVTRKMRMNINGKDTGWVDVNEDNEAQYNEMMEQFNTMHEQFNERFKNFFDFQPRTLLGFGPRKELEDHREAQ